MLAVRRVMGLAASAISGRRCGGGRWPGLSRKPGTLASLVWARLSTR
jgi:hypothetical protein